MYFYAVGTCLAAAVAPKLTSQVYDRNCINGKIIMANPVKTFGYAANEIIALELALSPERLQPYIARAGGSRAKAILIYERNTALSEALYGVTQAAEVGLRN